MLQTLKHNCFKIVPLEDCIDLKTPFREGKLMRTDTQLRFRKLKGGGGKFKHAKKNIQFVKRWGKVTMYL